MSESAEVTFLSRTGTVAQSLFDFANPPVVAESLFLILAAAAIAVVQNVSGDGDGRADALLSAVLVFRCLNAVAPIGGRGDLVWRGAAAALGALVCAGLIASTIGLWHVGPPGYLNLRSEERIFPIAAILFWWGISPARASVPTLARNLLLAGITVSLWTDIWDLVASVAGPWILESTIAGSITALYWLGYDVVRQGTVLHLGRGAIDILLGCTGLPILRLLLKLIVAESAILGLKARNWYVKATVIAIAISVFIGPFRVAILTLASSRGNRSFLFWHGVPGIGMFSALAMVLFLVIVGRLHQDQPVDGSPEGASIPSKRLT
jgi:exosortase/archaeosortase family protein